MNRIENKLNQLKQENKKALITFVTAGDPDLDTTEQAVLEMLQNGADIVEIGVPFSDPIAEGITIQNASRRALNNGVTLVKIFDMVKSLRVKTDEPLILMMYLNTIFGFGTERFFKLCVECGIDGIIVPDMPFEERDELLPYCEQYGVINISLVAPTSHQRISKIAENAKGFLYCVSSTGVTGVRSSFATNFDEFFGTIKKYAKVPCAVGFGISNEAQAKAMSAFCDGVIIGSAAVEIIEREKENSPKKVGEFTAKIRKALDQ